MLKQILFKCADEPFRLFFPLGIIWLLFGILFWPLAVYFPHLNHHTPQFHVQLMILGFMLSFIVGFLGTALPRFTQTKHFTPMELFLILAPYSMILHGIFNHKDRITYFAFLVLILVFLSRLLSRFLQKKRMPPPSFIYIPVAFLCMMIVGILQLQHTLNPITDPHLLQLSRLLFSQAIVLLLLMGIGSFLIKSILGWADPLPQNPGDTIPTFKFNKKIYFHLLCALFLLLSYFIEVWLHIFLGRVLRTFIVSFVLTYEIKVHKIPASGKLTAHTLRTSLILLMLGMWGQLLAPDRYYLPFAHLIFYGGFLLSTLSVATRVILSHCGYAHLLNQRYLPYSIACTFILLGLLGRFVADYTQTYLNHLAWAAILLACGVIIWSIFILGKCIRNTLQSQNTTANAC